METQFKTNIWLNRCKANKNGEAPVYIRITRNKRKVEISTGLFIHPIFWKSGGSEVSLKYKEAELINQLLAGYKRRIAQVKNQVILNDRYYDLNKIKDFILGKTNDSKTLMEVISYHNKNMKSLVGKSMSINTLKSYIFFEKKILKFMKTSLNKKDILLKDLDHYFMERFKTYMIVQDKNRPNTVLKNIVLFKKIINMCVDFDWMDKSPFKRIKIEKDEPVRTYLAEDELILIEQATITNNSVAKIRDMFIFQCYTGLGFVDLINLQWKFIIEEVDGKKWIKMNRQKTTSYFTVPLLYPAEKILLRYASNNKLVFAKISNQKYNAGLKKLMRLCKINKQISSHSGRRTFATTITLSNGIPIETVSKMLGHSDLRVTQIYAKVIDKKIADDMRDIINALEKERNITI